MEGTDPKSISFQDQNKTNFMIEVSIQKPHVFNPTEKISIICIDCGLKNHQLQILCQLDQKKFDGLFLSNDPGDLQTQCPDTIKNYKILD
ncbi:unnamed protein product [Rotaria sp. Silwood2]|nr:unnamed protein product [Rotaria sp. Silwood2]CAF2683566.1 unnamed protein product [Rotaria sp. Silwood2]CAF4592126.1 unnamed protein product [Rotaria sp. Silwood2]